MTWIKAEQLQTIFPKCSSIGWALPLNQAFVRYEINEPEIQAVLLAHIGVESAEMTKLEENLRYSAERLCEVWPSRFPNIKQAQTVANDPKKLANSVYNGRLGNCEADDGWRFHGRGLIQLTGRANYEAFSKSLPANDRFAGNGQLLIRPDILTTKKYAALSAAWFWASRPKLKQLAIDEPDDDDEADFRSITKIITGGATGLALRRLYWNRAKEVLKCNNKSRESNVS